MKRRQIKKQERNKRWFVIDALNNVDLTVHRPFPSITNSPKRGPYRATERHGIKVSNNETMAETLCGIDANAMIENR
jgi:hypothetical protein